MTQLERQIKTAQHRLWINQWLHALSLTLAIVAALFAIVVLVQRLFDLPLPLPQIGIGAAVVVLLASIIWTIVTRTDAATAAARLDNAAGLRERLSSGRYCRDAQDPFAAAVVADAERISQSISVRQHIRLRVPQPFAWSMLSVALAAMMFLVSPGLLARSEAKEDLTLTTELAQTKIAVKRQMDSVRQLMQSHPALETMEDKLGELDQQAGGQLRRPSDVRHEAIKKIDKLADAVKQKRLGDKYQATRDMRKLLRGLKAPKSSDAQTQKLNKALRDGDYKAARKEIARIQEQLATLKMEKDEELVAKLSKQLSDLAKQLEKVSKDKKLEQRLKQAGVKPEDVKRLLENLTKKDLDQLKKTLEKNGLSQQQIEKIAKQLQRKQQSSGMAQKLAQGMKKAAQASAAGQMGSAQAGLSMAADQLSELEMLEQEMNQLDAALADLQQSKNNLSKPCSSCNGVGCRQCQGNKGGMGRRGQGRGGVAPEQKTNVAFKTQRGKVQTGKGAIIGQFLFDGEQVKGDVSAGFVDVVTAAQHDASDRINRNRVPRQYHKAVKSYFSNVQRAIRSANIKTPSDGSTPGSDEDTGDSREK